MSTALLPNGQQQFIGANGAPLALGSVYFYIPGTSTFKNTWQDSASLTLNTNPVILDAAGRATIWGDGYYRQIVKDAVGNTIWDKVTSIGSTAVASPTVVSILNSPYTAASGTYIQVDASSGNITIVVSPTTYDVFVERTDTNAANVVIINDGTSNIDAITSVAAVAGILCPWRQISGDGSASIRTSGQG